MADTPFRTKGRVTGDDFFGRTDAIRTIVHHLRGKSSVAIMGEPRTGKSSLLTILFRNYKRAERDALTWFCDLSQLNSLEALIAEFFYGLRSTDSSYTLRGLAQELKNLETRYVIFIDNAERFAEPPFNQEALFALLASHMPSQNISLCVTSTTAPEKIFAHRIGLPLHRYFVEYTMTPFTPAECEQFIKRQLQWTGVTFSDNDIIDLIEASGGQPARLQQLAAELFKQRDNRVREDDSARRTIATKPPKR